MRRKSIPMTFTLAVLEEERPLLFEREDDKFLEYDLVNLFVAVHLYSPASPLLTEVNTWQNHSHLPWKDILDIAKGTTDPRH